MMNKIYIVICLLYTLRVSTAVLTVPEYHDEVNLTNCVISFVKELNRNVLYEIKDITVMNVYDEIDLSSIHKLERITVVSRIFPVHLKSIYNLAYILLAKNYNELHAALNQLTSDAFWNPKASFIIILRNFEDDNLNKIKKLLNDFNMYSITLICSKKYDYAIFMYSSTSNTCVKSERLVFVSWCSNYSVENRLLPLNRHVSIRNCRFKFVGPNLWPFVNFDDTGKKGLDQYTLNLFEKYSKTKIECEMYVKIDRYGNISQDFVRSMVNKLENNEVEGLLGGNPIGALGDGNFSHSYPLEIDYMVIVFAHAKALRQWEAVIRQYKPACIVVVILYAIICTAAILLSIFSTRRKDAVRDVLIVFGYILGKTFTNNINPGFSHRLVFTSLLFLALMVPYLLQAYLYSVTYNPIRGFEPKKIEDAKDYTPVLFSEMFYNYKSTSQDCGSRLNCLVVVKDNPNKSIFTIVSQTIFNTFAWMMADNECNLQLYTLKQEVTTMFRSVHMRRGSILLEHFDDFMFRVKAAGLPDKYLSDLYHKEWIKCKPFHQAEGKLINLRDLYGAFGVLLFGYILAAIALACELIFKARRV